MGKKKSKTKTLEKLEENIGKLETVLDKKSLKLHKKKKGKKKAVEYDQDGTEEYQGKYPKYYILLNKTNMLTMKDSVEDIAAILNLHTDSIICTNFFSEEDSKADFEFTPDTISNVTKMPGASNVTYKVDFKINGNSHSIIYRKFTNKLVDFRIENLIFQTLSDNKEGPYCFYQCNKYRIEEYIPSRTISIFELRNLNFMKEITSHFASFH